MSLHRSLKTKPGALNQHRNVLTRAERITQLTAQNRFDPDENSPLGLAKVTSRAAATGKKKKAAKQQEEGEQQEQTEEQEGAKPTPGA
jgi:small basic protein (TIGR04137 family)